MSNNLQAVHKTNNIITLHRYKTEFNADSVEWCPHDPYRHFFVCANYQLNTETEQRIGRILLFSLTSSNELKLWQTIDTSGVLDQKWCPNCPILAIVNASSTVEIYKLSAHLELITSLTLSCEALILSVDWSNEHEIICSDSKGNWHKLKFHQNELRLQESYKAHEFEAWIAAFYYWNASIFYTGGDDAVLLTFDIRSGTAPISKNRSHEAGVTSVHANRNKEFQIVTGSYDENVRLWDVRNMKEVQCLKRMPGPIWRLKWDPFDSKLLLSACMLGGAHVLGNNFEIVNSYYEHESMVYGADWCHIDGNKRIIGTCSFYDSLLCISEFFK